MNLKKIKQIPTFPAHKVIIKAINMWNGHTYTFLSPCQAIDYLCKYDVTVTVVKQRAASIKIMIECKDAIYERIKLDFVCNMGDKFVWKD